jgi:hypothetical protein
MAAVDPDAALHMPPIRASTGLAPPPFAPDAELRRNARRRRRARAPSCAAFGRRDRTASLRRRAAGTHCSARARPEPRGRRRSTMRPSSAKAMPRSSTRSACRRRRTRSYFGNASTPPAKPVSGASAPRHGWRPLRSAARRCRSAANTADRSADRRRSLIVDQIRAHRAKDKNFLPGVPDTVDGLHAYFEEQQAEKRVRRRCGDWRAARPSAG